ncbi:hypothetical protein CGT93_00540 [Vibrio metoecus]|nr:hypothetical protein CGT93_00540 [Vibrio metoecus]
MGGYLSIQKTMWGELSQAWTLSQAYLRSDTLFRSGVWPSVKTKNAEPKLRVDGVALYVTRARLDFSKESALEGHFKATHFG